MTDPPTTRVRCDIDFAAGGRQVSHLRVPHSDDRHAYGAVAVPIAVLAHGEGPTVLLTAGNHGDEYEGQIVLRRLLREIDPSEVRGRMIVLPALNAPAVSAATRVSPLDGGNMNRAFPGDPDGGPTAQIAHYLEHVVLPMCDYALDLHSGGSASVYVPCAFVRRAGDAALLSRKIAAAEAFGAPYSLIVDGIAENRSLSAACDRQGVAMIATELSGGGGVTLSSLALAGEGTRRLLGLCGVLSDDGRPAPPTAFLRLSDPRAFVMAPMDGLFEPAHRLGDRVAAGDRVGWIHPMDDPSRAPTEVRFAAGGTVVAERRPPLVRHGDYLCHTAVPVERESLGR